MPIAPADHTGAPSCAAGGMPSIFWPSVHTAPLICINAMPAWRFYLGTTPTADAQRIRRATGAAMNVLPYSAFEVLAMVMEGTHVPPPAVAMPPPVAGAPTPGPAPAAPAYPDFRHAA